VLVALLDPLDQVDAVTGLEFDIDNGEVRLGLTSTISSDLGILRKPAKGVRSTGHTGAAGISASNGD
jgi:hypothetical protein